MQNVNDVFQVALAALNSGRPDRADAGFRSVLKSQPEHIAALNLLTIALMAQGRFADAEGFISRAVALNAQSDVSFYNQGFILTQLKKYDAAIQAFDRAIALNPKVSETWTARGVALNQLGEFDRAIADFEKALQIDAANAGALFNLGRTLNAVKRNAEAIDAIDRAIAINPQFAESWFGKGAILMEMKKFPQAIDSFDKALGLNPGLAEAHQGRGNALRELKRFDEALKEHERAISLKLDFAEAYSSRGIALCELKRLDDAIRAHGQAIELKPDYAEAYANRGITFFELRNFESALLDYNRAIELKGDLAIAYAYRGYLMGDLLRHADSRIDFERAKALDPEFAFLEGQALVAGMMTCDWSNHAEALDTLLKGIARGKMVSTPFPVVVTSSSRELQRAAARMSSDQICKRLNDGGFKPETRWVGRGKYSEREKIRLAFLSGDFRSHAVFYLLRGVLAAIDRGKFEVFAFSFFTPASDPMTAQIQTLVDHFIDVSGLSDAQVASLCESREINICVDLVGYTALNRPAIMARRAAPIQVNYLGFPGTMGADFMDYIVADPTLIPASHRDGYAEKVLSLPHTYLPSDPDRPISDRAFSRSELGLPESGFVFCSFNNHYKLTPDVFDIWMNILKRVEGSVLWLTGDNEPAMANLRNEASARGVDAHRLIFAPRMPSLADHLARHGMAGLFLDTMPYNAHTTASDALWAGLPVLTRIGETFAGRVAASLLNAIGLPELITHSAGEYEELAVDLALNPDRLASIRKKLADNRLTTPVFDTARYTRDLEAAFTAIYERYHQGLAPDHIQVGA